MKISGIPHLKQSQETTCGAAALCMIYWYFGLEHQSEDKIWNRLKEQRKLNPSQEHIRTNNIGYDAHANGLHYLMGQAVWTDNKKALDLLQEFIKIKVPIIVCQKFRNNQPFGHYKIVIGLDEKFIYVNDPEFDTDETKVTIDEFMLAWQRVVGSDEVIGGEFVAILNDEQIKKLGPIYVYQFLADVKDFQISKLNFNS